MKCSFPLLRNGGLASVITFCCLVLFSSSVVVKAQDDAQPIITELYLNPINQPESFIELYNPTTQRLRASETQVCQGVENIDDCLQLKGRVNSGSYLVLCADISMHAECSQGLDFILNGNEQIVLRNSVSEATYTVPFVSTIQGVSYERTEGDNEYIKTTEITPGSGYPAVALLDSGNPRGVDFLKFSVIDLFNNNLEIAFRSSVPIADYEVTVYDDAGVPVNVYKLSEFTAGPTYGGITTASLPAFLTLKNSAVSIQGAGKVWDFVSMYSPGVLAQSGGTSGSISVPTGGDAPYASRLFVSDDCVEAEGDVWNFDKDIVLNCESTTTMELVANYILKGGSVSPSNVPSFQPSPAPSPFPSITGGPSPSPTADTCANSFCASNAICSIDSTNSRGYTCACNEGYEGNGFSCINIDECAQEEYPCGDVDNSFCVNTEGSFVCGCQDGYKLAKNRRKCNDINECRRGSPCGANSSCVNLPGTFNCACDNGYKPSTNGLFCRDRNECNQDGSCDPNALCVNFDGGFSCTCNTGYLGDGSFCNKITGAPSTFPSLVPTPDSEAPSTLSPSVSNQPSLSFVPSVSIVPSVTGIPTNTPSISDAPSTSAIPSLSSEPTSPSVSNGPSSMPSLKPTLLVPVPL